MNKVILIGNLAADPELRSTGSGISVCTFRIAVNRSYKSADGSTPVDWVPIVAWRQLGELCAKYLAKGRKVGVVGQLQSRSYEDKDGNKRTAYEVVADDIEFLTPRSESGGSGYSAPPPGEPPRYQIDDADVSGFTEMEDSQLPF